MLTPTERRTIGCCEDPLGPIARSATTSGGCRPYDQRPRGLDSGEAAEEELPEAPGALDEAEDHLRAGDNDLVAALHGPVHEVGQEKDHVVRREPVLRHRREQTGVARGRRGYTSYPCGLPCGSVTPNVGSTIGIERGELTRTDS